MSAPKDQLRGRSLAEVHASVPTTHTSFGRRLFAFAGPAYLVSVGYMDPGNWATDLDGGARFGYSLLWVLVMSNVMAILLQSLAARLGVVHARDLAQACRDSYPRPVAIMLWGLCEIAIAACDLAEVLGAAIGLNLLFQLPLLWGVLLTAGDTLIVLWLQQYRIRALEVLIVRLIAVIGFCLGIDVFLAKPEMSGIVSGLVPRIDRSSLFDIIAILGATVMPHNLYLHSGLVQSRRIGPSAEAKREACRYNLIDTMFALNGAMVVNIAILLLAAATFYRRGFTVTEIQVASRLLEPLLQTPVASMVFAIALLCAGQAATVTGTMAGQIVMEGFLDFRMTPWKRRLLTRLLAIVPAAIAVYMAESQGAYQLLIVTQAVLSLQLPFAVIPLIRFTSDRSRMGEFANSRWLRISAWLIAAINVGLNLWLAQQKAAEWLALEGLRRGLALVALFGVAGGLGVLLLYVLVAPLRRPKPAEKKLGDGILFVERIGPAGAAAIEQIEALVASLRGVAFIKDGSGKYVYVAGRCPDLFGLEADGVLSRTDADLSPGAAPGEADTDDEVWQELRTVETYKTVNFAGGSRSWMISKFPIVERETQRIFVGGVAVEVGLRKQPEERLKGLIASFQGDRERERAETSDAVHDLGQILTALSIRLSGIAARLSEGADPQAMAGRLIAATDVLASGIEKSARLSADLRPSALDHLGLAAAIQELAVKFEQRRGVRVVAELLDNLRLDPDSATVVYRLLEKSLDAAKARGSTEVRVRLRADGHKAALEIRDNGAVSDSGAPPFELGELARASGGSVHCLGEGAGNLLTIEMPLPSEGAAANGH